MSGLPPNVAVFITTTVFPGDNLDPRLVMTPNLEVLFSASKLQQIYTSLTTACAGNLWGYRVVSINGKTKPRVVEEIRRFCYDDYPICNTTSVRVRFLGGVGGPQASSPTDQTGFRQAFYPGPSPFPPAIPQPPIMPHGYPPKFYCRPPVAPQMPGMMMPTQTHQLTTPFYTQRYPATTMRAPGHRSSGPKPPPNPSSSERKRKSASQYSPQLTTAVFAKRSHTQAFASPPTAQRITPPTPATTTTTPAAYVKHEASIGDPDATPNTPSERTVLATLQGMQIDNPTEVLSSYRSLQHKNNGNPPTAEDVMIDIACRREQEEESRKMDEARKLSEQVRKAEAKERREAQQAERNATMLASSVDTWQTDMFPHSWILSTAMARLRSWISTAPSPLKVSVWAMLGLEAKARQWYGDDLPRPYFTEWATALQAQYSAKTAHEWVREETKRLEHVMYTLSEQTGGVPKVFRVAYDATLKTAGGGENDIALVDDAGAPKVAEEDKDGTVVIDLC